MPERNYLEIIDMYEEALEKQSEIIQKMGQLVKRQALELAELRTMLHAEEMEGMKKPETILT